MRQLKNRRRIAIIGAGQAGLQLALGLSRHRAIGYNISLFTDKTPETIETGKILSNQAMFSTALDEERSLNLDLWNEKAPQNTAISFTLADPITKEKSIYWQGKTSHPYQSVDQRLKFPLWMRQFKSIGGKLHIEDIDLKKLNEIAQEHDLTIVAGGKGEISTSFPRDEIRSHFNKPQRALGCLYVNGSTSAPGLPGVRATIIPGVGEVFMMPGLTFSGTCEMLLFEGIPNGPFDCWKNVTSTDEYLETAKRLLNQYAPWEAERFQAITLSDSKATLKGSYTPVVRHPIFTLPCGKSVLGIGDAVVLNDPIAGQGANNAAKAAGLYLQRILQQGEDEFDAEWMRTTFEENWHRYAKWSTKWSHLLLMPPAPYMIAILKAAEKYPTLANRLADGFDEPSTLFPWLSEEKQALQMIKDIETAEETACKEIYDEAQYALRQ